MRLIEPHSYVVRLEGWVLGLSLAQTSCLVLDEEHCLANGGDFACPERRCLFQAGGEVESKSDDFGCSYMDEFAPDHLHLKYGLPGSFEIDTEHRNLDTVKGILVALSEENGVADSCPLSSPELEIALDVIEASHPDIYTFRARLEEKGHVLRGPVKLTKDEVDHVVTYNEAVDEWLEACLSKAGSESP